MNLSGFIARRYLFAKKSHNVINIISGISAAGIAVGCAALVIILSIYNGFDSVVQSLYNAWSPDLVVEPSEGKLFVPETHQIDRLKADAAIARACPVLEETLYMKYGENQAIATARGVDSLYAANTPLASYLTEGSFDLYLGGIRQAVPGRTLALKLGARSHFLAPLECYFPSHGATLSLLDPMAALNRENLYVAGILSVDHQFDQKYIYVPLETLQRLLETEKGISALEIHASPEGLDRKGFATKELTARVRAIFPEGFTIRDRRQQNETLYKLISAERMAIYLILIFIMIIVSFTILGSLRMLIIEKSGDMEIMRAMGAPESLLRRIFVKEGWLISLIGIAVGVAAGLAVCLLQQKLGLVKMPGDFVVDAYPVVIRLPDVLLTVGGVALIGYVIALIPTRKLD